VSIGLEKMIMFQRGELITLESGLLEKKMLRAMKYPLLIETRGLRLI